MKKEKFKTAPDIDDEVYLQAFSEANDFKAALMEQNLSTKLQNITERYEIKDLLGEGAVKKVYLAFDKLMDRYVAFATIKDDARNLKDDFLREARLSSKLEHPYISPVYDMGFSEDGIPFFVMKLYDGQNLREVLLARNTFEISSNENTSWILDIFLKVCEALSFAHSKNVLHLDIKPSNIRINDHGEVLLCDWGISRPMQEKVSSSLDSGIEESSIISRSTLQGEVRGTPGFMAPEQLTKEFTYNEKMDIYGLGALLKDMLTGDPPGRGASIQEVGCPLEIAAICKKAISENPENRYNSVSALIDDINKYKCGMITSAEDADLLLVVKKWALRHKLAVIIVIFNSFLILTFLYVYIKDINDSRNNLEAAVNLLQKERDEKEVQRLELAKKYYFESRQLYRNSASKNDFNFRNVEQSLELINLSLDLNHEDNEAWSVLGRLGLILENYELSKNAFLKSGEKYKDYYEVVKNFKWVSTLEDYQNSLVLIKEIDSLAARNGDSLEEIRLRNLLIYKNIFTIKNKESLLKFSVGAIETVNRLENFKWTFDSETKSLDLSGNNNLKYIYPLKTSKINALLASNTSIFSKELQNLQYIPLKHLDVSYTYVRELQYLLNSDLEELNLEGNRIENLQGLENKSIKVLNIAHTTADLSLLKNFHSLKKITCTEKQASTLKELYGSKFDLKIIK